MMQDRKEEIQICKTLFLEEQINRMNFSNEIIKFHVLEVPTGKQKGIVFH